MTYLPCRTILFVLMLCIGGGVVASDHVNKRRFPCPECPSSLNNFTRLTYHYVSQHRPDLQWFICMLGGCNKKCVNGTELKAHARYMHPGHLPAVYRNQRVHEQVKRILKGGQQADDAKAPRYACPDCEAAYFASMLELAGHYGTHHEPSLAPYYCTAPACKARFAYDFEIEAHVLAAHQNGNLGAVHVRALWVLEGIMYSKKGQRVKAVHQKSVQGSALRRKRR